MSKIFSFTTCCSNTIYIFVTDFQLELCGFDWMMLYGVPTSRVSTSKIRKRKVRNNFADNLFSSIKTKHSKK